MKKFHVSIITIISIIILLTLLFFTTPIKSHDIGIEHLRNTSNAFAYFARSTSLSVVIFTVI